MQHPGMGYRAIDIVMIQALVKLDRGGESFHKGICGFIKPATPGFDRVFSVTHNILDCPADCWRGILGRRL